MNPNDLILLPAHALESIRRALELSQPALTAEAIKCVDLAVSLNAIQRDGRGNVPEIFRAELPEHAELVDTAEKIARLLFGLAEARGENEAGLALVIFLEQLAKSVNANVATLTAYLFKSVQAAAVASGDAPQRIIPKTDSIDFMHVPVAERRDFLALLKVNEGVDKSMANYEAGLLEGYVIEALQKVGTGEAESIESIGMPVAMLMAHALTTSRAIREACNKIEG